MKQNNIEKGRHLIVLTSQPINNGLLTYIAPDGGVRVGDFVEVPIGKRSFLGVVWAPTAKSDQTFNLKVILSRVNIPRMTTEMQTFLLQMSEYTINPLNKVFKLAVRNNYFRIKPKKFFAFQKGRISKFRMTSGRSAIMSVFDKFPEKALSKADLKKEIKLNEGALAGLVKTGVVIQKSITIEETPHPYMHPTYSNSLSIEQSRAAKVLRKKIRKKSYETTLLKGVTGSGKTEVYFDAISQTIDLGYQVLILLPEIALTIEFVKRITDRFGVEPAEWHSGISLSERRRIFLNAANNNLQLVIGARSALFLPFKKLGLIVVDEEHDGSYKQEEGVCYNARDMAVLRSSLNYSQVILTSATPSLESWVNCKTGKYSLIELKERFGLAVLPKIKPIDLKTDNLKKGQWISSSLKSSIAKRLEKKEQTLLFLNRRGYSPITVCRSCGFQFGCENCDARLVNHKSRKLLICHQCGVSRDLPPSCPNCEKDGHFATIGPGIERLAEEAEGIFPQARIGILSSDSVDNKDDLKRKIKQFSEGEVDIIIGTQLVSKGYNFPKITLVGVIDSDLALQGSDLRASEKSFQLLRQVSGRSGRDNRMGEALLQTYVPEHPVIVTLVDGDDECFLEAETNLRRQAKVPPFGKMVAIILSGREEKVLLDFGRFITGKWHSLGSEHALIFGPAVAPISKIRGKSRVRILIKSEKLFPIQRLVKIWLSHFKIPKYINFSIDVDPHNFY